MLLVLRLGFGLLALFAIGRQLTIHIQNSADTLNFFSYFTNLSNLFAALVLLLGTFNICTRRGPPNDLIRAAAVVNMVVVGVVFAVLLRETDLGSLLPWINFVLHYVMPCVMVIDWLLQPPRTQLRARQLLLVLVFPVFYLAYVLVRGSIRGWYPYPFLNPDNLGGYAGVAAYGVGISATFLAAGWALLALGNWRRRAAPAR